MRAKTSTPNEILAEIWRVKDALAAEYNYDLNAMSNALRERKKNSGRHYVDLSKPRGKSVAKKKAA